MEPIPPKSTAAAWVDELGPWRLLSFFRPRERDSNRVSNHHRLLIVRNFFRRPQNGYAFQSEKAAPYRRPYLNQKLAAKIINWCRNFGRGGRARMNQKLAYSDSWRLHVVRDTVVDWD